MTSITLPQPAFCPSSQATRQPRFGSFGSGYLLGTMVGQQSADAGTLQRKLQWERAARYAERYYGDTVNGKPGPDTVQGVEVLKKAVQETRKAVYAVDPSFEKKLFFYQEEVKKFPEKLAEYKRLGRFEKFFTSRPQAPQEPKPAREVTLRMSEVLGFFPPNQQTNVALALKALSEHTQLLTLKPVEGSTDPLVQLHKLADELLAASTPV